MIYPTLSAEGITLLQKLSRLAFEEGFFLVGGILPFKPNEKTGNLVLDAERDSGTFTNVGDTNSDYIGQLLKALLMDYSMSRIQKRMLKEEEEKEN